MALIITDSKKPAEAIANVYKTPDATVIVTDIVTDSSNVAKVVEEMPKYPGGQVAMIKFLTENLHYPKYAKSAGIEGRVTIRFVVSKTGQISDVIVKRGLDESCDKKALRVVKAMPRWEQGKIKGEPVNVYDTLPITFKLSF